MRIRVLVAGAMLAVAGSVHADIMSLNFYDSAGGFGDSETISGTEAYGVASLGTVVDDWNNAANFNLSSLSLDDGSASTIGFVRSAPNGEATFNVAYTETPMQAGYDSFLASDVTVTINNLNANFSQGYYAIAYLTGFNGNTGASISDGTSSFYFQTANPATATLVQTSQTSDLGDGANPVANYAVFGSVLSPLSSDSITFTLDTLYGGASGFGGLQIVAVPEPSTFSLVSFASLALLFRRRRFGD